MIITVHLLPSLVTSEELLDSTVVVVDILRATTTVTYAVAAGAGPIVPCLEVDGARAIAQRQPTGVRVLLGGERGGRRIDGFDLGNSPLEYTADRVRGCVIAFSTTNGTRALEACRSARKVWLGSFANLAALRNRLSKEPRIAIVCAGERGRVSSEDSLFAGALVEQLARDAPSEVEMNDAAFLCRDAWQRIGGDKVSTADLARTLRRGAGGRNLLDIDHGADIDHAAKRDQVNVVPELDLVRWEIRAAHDN